MTKLQNQQTQTTQVELLIKMVRTMEDEVSELSKRINVMLKKKIDEKNKGVVSDELKKLSEETIELIEPVQTTDDDTDMSDYGDDEPKRGKSIADMVAEESSDNSDYSSDEEDTKWREQLATTIEDTPDPNKWRPRYSEKYPKDKQFYNTVNDNYRAKSWKAGDTQCEGNRWDNRKRCLVRCKKKCSEALPPVLSSEGEVVIVGRDVCKLCFEGAKKTLTDRNTQSDWSLSFGTPFGFYDDPTTWHRDWQCVHKWTDRRMGKLDLLPALK